ncbi:MAG: hypothetical protein ACR2QF_07020 [Geminicoccaceae bacterium]
MTEQQAIKDRLGREDEVMKLLAEQPTVQARVLTVLMEVSRGKITPAEGYNALWLMGFFPSISS